MLDLVLSARQWFFPLVFVAIGSAGSLLALPLAAAILAAVIGLKVLSWSRFTYEVTAESLVLDHGILNRKHREIPLGRIQQVDLQRKLRHRLLGVAVVRVDTAGGSGGAEVVLEAIANDDALALRGALLSQTTRTSPAAAAVWPTHGPDNSPAGGPYDTNAEGTTAAQYDDAPETPEVVAQLTSRQLAIAGISGSRLAAMVPLLAAGFGLLNELPGQTTESATETIGNQLSSALVLGAIAVLIIPLILAVAAATSILTDHEFTLVRSGTDLHLRRGLLDQREATLSLHRIQVVRVHTNPLRRLLGVASVELQSAGSGSGADGRVSRMTIPYVEAAALDQLLAQVLPGSSPRPELVPAPAAARRRAWVRRVVPAAVLAAVLALVTQSWWGTIAFLLLVPAIALAESAYRGLGHAATPSFLFTRRGGVFRELAVIPVAKTQSSRLHSSPFQRRVGLATLELDMAGKGRQPAIVDGAVGLLSPLQHQALYASDARADEGAVRRRARRPQDSTAATPEPMPTN